MTPGLSRVRWIVDHIHTVTRHRMIYLQTRQMLISLRESGKLPCAMSRRIPTPEELNALRDHFRKMPPSTARDFKFARLIAGVSEEAATRAWSRGWPGVEAIESQLARERAVAAQQAEVLKARSIVTTMKANAVVLQNEMRRVLPAVKALTSNLAANLADLEALKPDAAAKLLQRVAKVQKDVTSITAKSVELDRLIAGEATSIVGHRSIEPEAPVDIEQAEAVHAALGRSIARHKKARTAALPPVAENSDVAGN